MTPITEANVEQLALDELRALGWQTVFGPDIAPDGDYPEREAYHEVVLKGRLREALERINPDKPAVAIEEAMRQVLTPESPSLVENNRRFHRMLTDGVDVSWMDEEGEQHGKVWLLDVQTPENNDWLAVHQFTVRENRKTRRPDIVLFVNGLPLVVIELKNPSEEQATLQRAFQQLQTYKNEIPSLFVYNALLVISDGMQARFGTITSGWDRFMPWRTIDGTDLYREPGNEKQHDGEMKPGLTVLLRGMFAPARFQDTRHCAPAAFMETPRRSTPALSKLKSATPSDRSAKRKKRINPLATGGQASSGIPRARAKAFPWSSTPAKSSGIPPCKTPPSWC